MCGYSYGHELCLEILGRPFDRCSVFDRAVADSDLEDWYTATLDSYRLWFGNEPDADTQPREATAQLW